MGKHDAEWGKSITAACVRHGPTSLFAALDVASGFVIGKCYHRAAEFLNFLKEIDAQVPEGLDIHIVMDNYATHKTSDPNERFDSVVISWVKKSD